MWELKPSRANLGLVAPQGIKKTNKQTHAAWAHQQPASPVNMSHELGQSSLI